MALGPIIIHLLNRRRYRIVDWAAANFLLESFKKTKRRIRLEQWLLLTMRVAGVGMMGFALARPFVPEQSLSGLLGTQARSDHVVILDDSYSMSQAIGSSSIFARAREALLQISDRVQSEDTFAVILTSRTADDTSSGTNGKSKIQNPLFAPGHLTDRGSFKRDASALAPSDFSTDLVPSLNAALEIFANSSNPEKRLYVLTDCRRRDWSDENGRRIRARLEKLDPKTSRIFVLDFGAADAANLSIVEFTCAEKHVVENLPARFRVTVINRGSQPVRNVPVTFRAGDATLPPRLLDRLAPGEKATLDFSYVFRSGARSLPDRSKPARAVSVSVSLPPDAIAADNAAHLALEVREGVPLLVVNGSPDPEPYVNETDYLTAALNPGGKGLGGWQPAVVTERDLAAAQFSRYDLVVLANVAALPQPKIAELEAYVRDGGSVVIFLGNRVDTAFYNAALFKDGKGLLPCQLGVMEGDPANAEKSFRLKVEAGGDAVQTALGGEVATLISHVHVRAFQLLSAAKLQKPPSQNLATVLASFNDPANSPALVARSLGKGRVLLFASTASARWHDWPGNPSYPVFINELCNILSRTPSQDHTARIGTPIERMVEPQFLDGGVTLRTPLYPQQPALRLTPQPVGDQMRVRSADIGHAGVYEMVLDGNGTTRTDLFARNVDYAEGDLAKADQTSLAAAFGDAPVRLMPNLATAELDLREKGRGKEFWKYILIAVLGLLVVEQTLARRFTHL